MKKALILVNPYANTEAAAYQPRRLKEELTNLGVRADILPNRSLAAIGREDFVLPAELSAYDFCVYLDKDKYTPRILEKRGMRLFNRAAAVEVCDDKMLTAIALAGEGIPMPLSLAAPLCYAPPVCAEEEAAEVARRLALPVVVKECYGSLGRQVYLAQTAEELSRLCEKLALKPHLYQEYISESGGRDLRIVCVGGEAVAAMERTNRSDFRSNLALGGRGEKREPDAEAKALCGAVSRILGLDYCGIDLLFSPRGGGKYLVCEVNSNAFFGGIERATGVNVARLYAEYMLRHA